MARDRTAARRGFILATSLLVLTLLTVMLTAAFILVSAEFRTTDNAASGARALALAEAGLANYLSLNRGLQPTDTGDSLRITLTGGYTDVIAQRMRAAVGGTPSLWTLRATGYPADPLLSGTPQSKRTVARLVELYPGQLPARAGMIALNGVQITGASGSNPLDGSDYVASQTGCTWPGSPASDSFALSVFRNAGQYVSGGVSAPFGGVDSLTTTRSQLYDSTHINWVSLSDTTYANFTPDYLLPPGPLQPPGPTTNYLVGYAPGDYTMAGWAVSKSSPRKGVLVVGGNLTMQNDTHWDGVILVGGRLIIAGGATSMIIDGQIITGLNTQLPSPPVVTANVIPRSASLGDFRIAWSWCYATIAAESLSGFAGVRRAWTDGWALY